MDFLNKLSAKAGETFQAVKDSDTTKRVKNYAEIPGLSVQVGKQESVIKKAYEEIGKAYYKANKNDSSCEYADQIKVIKEAFEKIDQLKAEIDEKKHYDPLKEDDVVSAQETAQNTVIVPSTDVSVSEE